MAGLSQAKACQMLEEGRAQGQELSPAQQRLFGAVCSGQRPRRAEDGTVVVMPDNLQEALMEMAVAHPDERYEIE